MYSIYIIHRANDSRESILRQAIADESARLAIPVACLDPAQMDAPSSGPKVIVYLGDFTAKSDANCTMRVQTAVSLGLPIIPVIDQGDRRDQVPVELVYMKHIRWHSAPPPTEPPGELISTALDFLGITERERRVFISYRQADAISVATQLFHELSEHRFAVFLDRFQTMPGEDFQERIDEELEDIAFVLLLQSPDMHNSTWVDWEITHALKSRLPLLVLKWTNAPVLAKLEQADFPTVELDPSVDLQQGILAAPKLIEVVHAVELNHAEGLLRRRKESIMAARDLAVSKGLDVVEEPGWKLLLQRRSAPPTVLGITPRLSRVENLEELDSWVPPVLPAVGIRWRRLLMQTSTELSPRRRRLLEWAIDGRDLMVLLGTGSLEQNL